MAPALPVVEPCERCGKTKELRMEIRKRWDDNPADHEIRIYLCFCGITVLESKDGGPWRWRIRR